MSGSAKASATAGGVDGGRPHMREACIADSVRKQRIVSRSFAPGAQSRMLPWVRRGLKIRFPGRHAGGRVGRSPIWAWKKADDLTIDDDANYVLRA